MVSSSGSHNEHKRIDDPLYNSLLIKNYITYIKEFHPDIEIDSILNYAGITRYEVEDQGHWLSQCQVDRFNELLIEKTGNSNISREVGRYAASSKASGALRQYTLGFVTPSSAYRILEKQASTLSRGFTLKTRKIASDKIEVTVTQKPGVMEKPYQCENRTGIFEAVAKLFTNELAKVEHPSCFHKGDDCCRYIITWGRTRSIIWNRGCNYSILASMLVSLALFFVLPILPWVFVVLFCVLLAMTFSLYSQQLKKKELSTTIETQGDAAIDHLDEMNIRYNNALVIQEIGQATSTILD
ncbi:MAG TPA: hypothetical protein DDW42_05620, partial [Desulfobacteraceae bacterium]|nr:hypothetical protein [Desulfobacteraceae bacterium]